MLSSSKAAALLLGELLQLGVQDIVVCPGSRSQALALIAGQAEKLGLCRLHVRVDERSAAFLALGIALETGIPAPVIVTSGTAVANLLPAVLEAHSARVPLLLLTADRPAKMRGTRANQTVHKPAVLSSFTRLFVDVAASSLRKETVREAFLAATNNELSGPAQLNISFAEPLSETGVTLNDYLGAENNENNSKTQKPELVNVKTGSGNVYVHKHDDGFARAIIIAGDKAGSEAEEFAQQANLPLLAEPSSGSRYGREAIQYWEKLLKEPRLQQQIQRIIVFGHPTLTRTVPELIKKIDTVVIDKVAHKHKTTQHPDLELYNPGLAVKSFAIKAEVSKAYDRETLKPWLGQWVIADRKLRSQLTTIHEPDLEAAKQTGYKERSAYARSEVARMRRPVTREHLSETLWLATWPHDRLVVGSSRLIRVLNEKAAPRNIKVIANRGLAGIDGTIATAFGVAATSQTQENPRLSAGTTRVLLGDLTFFHDVASLAMQPGEYQPRIQIIVGNDGGGTIFDLLEVYETADKDLYRRVMTTPQTIEIAEIAKAYGYEYRLIENEGELENLLTEPVNGPQIVEVKLS